MKGLLWHGHRILRRVGWPALAASVLLAANAIAYIALLAPLKASLLDVRRDTQDLRDRLVTRRADTGSRMGPVQQLGAFYGFFPGTDAAVETLGKIYAAAAHENLTLAQGDYRQATEMNGMLLRYDLTLPIKGPYASVRRFVARALKDTPSLALESVSFGRQASTDIGVEAQVSFTLYMKANGS